MSLKCAAPRRTTESNAAPSSSAFAQRRIPMPPPPAVLLSITGKPIRLACACASARSASRPVPGRSGSRASVASARAVCFSPNARICSEVGPMKTIPVRSQRAASSGFSARKP